MRPAQTPAGSSRLAGAAGALLLQGGFLLLFLASMPALHPPVPLQRELSLILSRRFAPLPSLLQTAPGPSRVAPPPNLSPPSPLITAPLLPEPGVPDFSTRLQALGQALNGLGRPELEAKSMFALVPLAMICYPLAAYFGGSLALAWAIVGMAFVRLTTQSMLMVSVYRNIESQPSDVHVNSVKV